MDRDFWGRGREAVKGVFTAAKASVQATWKGRFHRPVEQYVQEMHPVRLYASRFAALVLLEEDGAGSTEFGTRLVCPKFFAEAFLYMVSYHRGRTTNSDTTYFRARFERSWPMFQQATAYERRQFYHAPWQVTDCVLLARVACVAGWMQDCLVSTMGRHAMAQTT